MRRLTAATRVRRDRVGECIRSTMKGKTMEARRVALLQQMPLFGGIRADVLAFLVSVSQEARVGRGEYFFREGEHGESMFVLESGAVDVIRRSTGTSRVLC